MFYITCSLPLAFISLLDWRSQGHFVSHTHRFRHRLNSCSHSWETKTRENISFQQCVSTHCYQEFLRTRIVPFSLFSLCKVTMSDSIHGLLLSSCPCLSSLSLRLNTLLSLPPSPFFVLSHFIPMLHSSRVRIFIFFVPPLRPPHLGQQRPTGTYLVSVFIPAACLWPTGKLQCVICLQVDRNLPFSSSLAAALTSKLVTTLNLRS